MGIESLDDDKIAELLECRKRVTNPSARKKNKGKHLEKNYKVIDSATGDLSFNLYLRQNTLLDDDFSCGLSWNMPSGEVITLARYNGSSHAHPNHIEAEKLGYTCHIHKATERYILAGKKPEGYAEATTDYSTLAGALHCLVTDCNISGISTDPEHPDLFARHEN